MSRGPFLLASILLALATISLTGWSLGRIPLHDWDEALTAVRARSLGTDGDWITPRVNGAPDLHKPPLHYWLVRASQEILGESEISVRLPGVLAAAGLVVVVFAIGSRVAGPSAGFLSAALLVTFPYFLDRVRHASPDLVLLLCSYGAVFAFLSSRYVRMGLFVGASILAKGLAGFLAPLAAAVHVALTGHLGILADRRLWLGVLASVAIVLPWVGWNTLHHGEAFRETFVGAETAGRIPWPLPWRSHAAYYFRSALDFLFPGILAAPLWLTSLPAGVRRGEGWRENAIVLALLVASLTALVVVRPADWRYLVIVMPVAGLAGGIGVAHWIEIGPRVGTLVASASLAALTILVGGDLHHLASYPAAVAIAALVGGWLIVSEASALPRGLAAVALALLVLPAASNLAGAVEPRSDPNHGLRELAPTIRETVPAGTPVFTDRGSPQGIEWYADRRVEPVEAFFQRGEAQPERMFFVSDSDLHRGIAGYRTTEIARAGGTTFARLDRDRSARVPNGIRIIAPVGDPAWAGTVALLAPGAKRFVADGYDNYVLEVPAEPPRFVDRTGWSLTSNGPPGDPTDALDGDPATAWRVDSVQRPGLSTVLDMGRVASVSGIRLLTNRWRGYPHGLSIEGSVDAESWTEILHVDSFHPGFRLRPSGIEYERVRADRLRPERDYSVEARFDALEVRYFRLSITSGHPKVPWKIAEIDTIAE